MIKINILFIYFVCLERKLIEFWLFTSCR